MNKTLKRVLSLVLCIVLALSSVSLAFAAQEEEKAPSLGAQYFLSASNAENTGFALDYIDTLLAEQNIYSKVVILEKTFLTPEVALEIDLRNINGVCKTVDTLSGIFTNKLVNVAAKLALGDIGDLDLSSWKTGLSRRANDVEILYCFLDLLGDNAAIIAKVVDNSIDLGVLKTVVNLDDLLGADGVSGLIKGLLVSFIYNKDSQSELYNAAYSKAVKDFDAFIFEDFIPALAADDLPGLKLSKGITVDQAFSAVFGSLWNAYIAPAIKNLNIPKSSKALRVLSEIMEFSGENIDLSAFPFDSSKGLKSQLNNMFGYVAAELFPSFTGWIDGSDIKLLSKNLEKLYSYAADHFRANEEYFKDKDVTPVEVLRYILQNITAVEAIPYREAVKNSKDLKDALKAILIVAAVENEIPVNEKAASYENVLGDYLAFAANIILDLGYGPGSGKNVWTVANDVLNVYLFDKGFAAALNLNVKKTDSCFEKLDKIIGTTKLWSMTASKTQYKSETVLKGFLEAVFGFDFESLVNLTVVNFLNDFEKNNISVLLYDLVYNFLENWFGTPAIVKCDTKAPFQTGFSNASLKVPVEKLLTGLSEKKSKIVPPFIFVAAILIENFLAEPTKVDLTAISVADQAYTGKAVVPSAVTVTVNGRKVKIPSYQFTAELQNNVDIGVATGTVSLNGAVKDMTVGVTFKIVPAKVTNVKAAPGKNSVTLTWNAAAGAASYVAEYYDGSRWVAKTVTGTSTAISGLKAGTVYKFRVKAVNGSFSGEYSATVSASTVLAKVTKLRAKTASTTATSITLTWNAVTGAKKYEVQIYKGGKWVTVRTVTENKALVGKNYIKANKSYKFRVRAIGSSAALNGEYSDTLTAYSGLEKVNGLKVTEVKKNSVTLGWKKVAGASKYEIQVKKGNKWVTVSTVKGTKTTIANKQLKKAKLTFSANTRYSFRVRATKTVSKANVYGAYATVKVRTAKR